MPKVLVLFHSRAGSTAALAEAIAEGAGSVKFTEVELRRIDDPAPGATSKHRALESVESLADYDGLIVGGVARDGAASAEVTQLLERAAGLASRGLLADKVGSAFSVEGAPEGERDASTESILLSLMRLGMLIVPPGAGDANGARQLGARVAKVTEWVRHAKSHEHGHSHSH